MKVLGEEGTDQLIEELKKRMQTPAKAASVYSNIVDYYNTPIDDILFKCVGDNSNACPINYIDQYTRNKMTFNVLFKSAVRTEIQLCRIIHNKYTGDEVYMANGEGYANLTVIENGLDEIFTDAELLNWGSIWYSSNYSAEEQNYAYDKIIEYIKKLPIYVHLLNLHSTVAATSLTEYYTSQNTQGTIGYYLEFGDPSRDLALLVTLFDNRYQLKHE